MKISKTLTALTLAMLVACGGGGGSAPPVAGGGGSPTTPSEPGLEPAPAAPDYWPTTAWTTATPESHGFETNAFANLATEAETDLPFYTSLLVIKDGYLVHESYHSTASASYVDETTKHQLWSVTKSVTSMIVGRAITLGDLAVTDLDSRVGDVFSAADSGLAADDARNDITLRDALRMRSGLSWNEGEWLLRDLSRDPLFVTAPSECASSSMQLFCKVMQRPVAYTHGSTWNYSTYDSQIVSAFFTAKTAQTLEAYGNAYLFSLLGINASDLTWGSASPQSFGGGLLGMRSRDIARLGLLALYNGKWDGQTLLSPEWMETSLTSQGTGPVAQFDATTGEPSGSTNQAIDYGMQWWLRTEAGVGDIMALGLGGQQMHIIRSKGLVILVTCDGADLFGSTRQDEIAQFIRDKILARLN